MFTFPRSASCMWVCVCARVCGQGVDHTWWWSGVGDGAGGGDDGGDGDGLVFHTQFEIFI